MIQRLRYILLISILLFAEDALTQQKYEVRLEVLDTPKISLFVEDSMAVYRYLDSIQRADFEAGYLTSSVDQVFFLDSIVEVSYYKGDVFKYGKIRFEEEPWLTGFLTQKIKSLEGTLLQPAQLSKLSDQIITDLENAGYPFASVKLDSTEIKEGIIEGRFKIDRSTFITMDVIQNNGNLKISNGYLQRYLDIRPGDTYDRRLINALKNKLRELAFAKSKSDPKISFVNKKAKILLDLDKHRSSHFDFIIGLLQNQTPEGQKYTITGDFTAEMLNKLGYGERFYLHFQRLRPENQTLEIAFDYPFILDTPFGTQVSFNLFRNMDQWIDTDLEIGAQYYLQGRDYLNLSWVRKGSNLLSIDTALVRTSGRLPARLDYAYNGLGMGIHLERLHYRFNPSSGYEIDLKADAGFKKIIKNNSILALSDEDIDFDMIYDDLELNTYQLGVHFKGSYYQPLTRNITIRTGVNAGYQYNQQQLLENEFYRIGGNKLLRGFDEQSILSTFYSVMTAELRFILAQQDNNFTLSLPFIDYGVEYNPLREEEESGTGWDRPIGVGIGMNFQTGAGIFSFAIAAGKRLDNPFDFSNLKIHFGYVNLF